MSSSNPTPCESYRETYLASLSGAASEVASLGGHVKSCGACSAWAKDALMTSGVLGSLDRLVAPSGLEALVEEDILLGSGSIQGALRGMERQSAPAALDALVAKSLLEAAHEAPIPDWQALLEDLPRATAPQVLDRLVSEEIADGKKAVTRRFVGGLFRFRSPESLESRLQGDLSSSVQVVRRDYVRRLSLGSAVAAALLVWSALPNLKVGAKTPQFRLQVVEVANLQELSPIARSLVSDLTGGMLDAMPMTSFSPSEPKAIEPEQPTTDGGGL